MASFVYTMGGFPALFNCVLPMPQDLPENMARLIMYVDTEEPEDTV